jgi:hypothetical protein
MKALCFAATGVLALAMAGVAWAQAATPHMTAVEPTSGKSGDVLTVTGENLDNSTVAALYLTDEKNDIKVGIVSETSNSIKFTIPAGVKPGDFALMVLTKGDNPKYIEEPVRVITK